MPGRARQSCCGSCLLPNTQEEQGQPLSGLEIILKNNEFACPLIPFSLSTLVYPNQHTTVSTLIFLSPTNPHSPACPECLTRAWTRPCPLYLSPLTASSSRTLRLLPCSHRQAAASVQPGRQGRLRSSSLSRGRTSYHPPAALTWHTQQPTHQLFSFAWEK